MQSRHLLRKRPRPDRAPRVALGGDTAMMNVLTGYLDSLVQVDLVLVNADEPVPVCDALVICSPPGEEERFTTRTVSRLAGSAAQACQETAVIIAARRGLSLCRDALRASALEPGRIISTGALPAVRRESIRLARHHDVCVTQVHVPALGGDSPAEQLVLERYASIGGIPASMLGSLPRGVRPVRFGEHNVDQIIRAAALITEAVILDRRAVLSCGAWIEGTYGLPPCYAVAPVRVSARGASSPLPLSLTLEEKALLMRSAAY